MNSRKEIIWDLDLFVVWKFLEYLVMLFYMSENLELNINKILWFLGKFCFCFFIIDNVVVFRDFVLFWNEIENNVFCIKYLVVSYLVCCVFIFVLININMFVFSFFKIIIYWI